MSNIDSLYNGKIVSEHKTSKITSKTVSQVQSKTALNVLSDAEAAAAAEKAAFLPTAKHNALLCLLNIYSYEI